MSFQEDLRREWEAALHNFSDLPQAQAYMASRIPVLQKRARARTKRIRDAANLFYGPMLPG